MSEESRKAWAKGKLDKNGYAESIIGAESHFCYYCGRYGDTARHEIFGSSNRQQSKADGLWVSLCPYCHKWEHEGGGLERDGVTLKQIGQMAYERTHTREEFIKRYGRNYL